jgi:hypothetical protein
MLWSLPAFAGTVLGCFLFALLLSFIPGLRSQTTGKLLIINIISWVFLAVGDNAVRENEDLGETLTRVGLAQLVVLFLMVGWATAKKKGAGRGGQAYGRTLNARRADRDKHRWRGFRDLCQTSLAWDRAKAGRAGKARTDLSSFN